jgi:hypothetical protein
MTAGLDRRTDSKFTQPERGRGYPPAGDGHLLGLQRQHSDRTPLNGGYLDDNDTSYPYRRNIADGKNDYAYPIAFQASDGKIHLVYTSDRRQVIRHAVFEESAILR